MGEKRSRSDGSSSEEEKPLKSAVRKPSSTSIAVSAQKPRSKATAEKSSSKSEEKKPTKKSKAKVASDSDDEDTDGGAIAEQDEDSDPSESDAKKVPAVKVQKGKDGEHYIEVGNKRRITVRSFKGAPLVDIREFYTDPTGEMKPGKKGISLNLDQWKDIKAAADTVDKLLAKLK